MTALFRAIRALFQNKTGPREFPNPYASAISLSDYLGHLRTQNVDVRFTRIFAPPHHPYAQQLADELVNFINEHQPLGDYNTPRLQSASTALDISDSLGATVNFALPWFQNPSGLPAATPITLGRPELTELVSKYAGNFTAFCRGLPCRCNSRHLRGRGLYVSVPVMDCLELRRYLATELPVAIAMRIGFEPTVIVGSRQAGFSSSRNAAL